MKYEKIISTTIVYSLVFLYVPLFLMFTYSSVVGVINFIDIFPNLIILLLNLFFTFFVVKYITNRYSGWLTVIMFLVAMWCVPIIYYIFNLATGFIRSVGGGHSLNEVLLQGKLTQVTPSNVMEIFITDFKSGFSLITGSVFLLLLFIMVVILTYSTIKNQKDKRS